MKYHIIVSIFVFLFLNACNPDSNNINQNNSKKELKTERIPNKQIKNALLDDLKNLIETASADKKIWKKLEEEPSNQYGISIFKEIYWIASYETVADNTERSKNYRKFTYATLNSINTNKLANLSKILIRSKQKTLLFGTFCNFGSTFDTVINHLLCLKKETLDTLAVSDLKKLKNSFEKLLSIKTDISKMLEQLLLDYKDYINSTKTDIAKLESHLTELYKQIAKKSFQTTELKNNILSISNL